MASSSREIRYLKDYNQTKQALHQIQSMPRIIRSGLIQVILSMPEVLKLIQLLPIYNQ